MCCIVYFLQIAAVCTIMLVHLKYYLDDFWIGLNSVAKGLVTLKKIMVRSKQFKKFIMYESYLFVFRI